MNQPVEIFFASDGSVEAVMLPKVAGAQPLPAHVAFGFRLVGSPRLSERIEQNWGAVVICTPKFEKANHSKPVNGRPRGVSLQFMVAS